MLRAAFSYYRTIIDPGETDILLQHFGFTMNVPAYYATAILSAVMGCYHLWIVYSTLRFSYRRGRVLFTPRAPSSQSPPSSTVSSSSRGVGRHLLQLARQHTQRVLRRASDTCFSRCLRRYWLLRRLDRAYRLISVHGPYFDASFHCRELIELCVQAYQAYCISYLVPHAWLNIVSVGVIVLNCWSTPLLFYWYPHEAKKPIRRVLCLAVDIVLDFCSSIIIPYAAYVSFENELPAVNHHDPVWLLKIGNDLLFFLTNTWADLISRIMPAVSMTLCLAAVQNILYVPDKHNTLANPLIPTASVLERQKTNRPGLPDSVTHANEMTNKFFHWMFFACGIAAVAVSSYASLERQQHVQGCHVPMHRWLTRKYSCGMLEIDCKQLNIDGSLSEVDSILGAIDNKALQVLMFSHCQAVDIPIHLEQFPNLIWVETYNSTVLSFQSLTNADWLTRLSTLVLLSSRFGAQFISELRDVRLPPALVNLEFVDTNLTTVPMAFQRQWTSRLLRLTMEKCQLESLPEGFAALPAANVSLSGNRLASVPDILLANKTFSNLWLGGNPLTQLPSLPENDWPVIGVLHLQHVPLSDVPEWVCGNDRHAPVTSVMATSDEGFLCQGAQKCPNVKCCASVSVLSFLKDDIQSTRQG